MLTHVSFTSVNLPLDEAAAQLPAGTHAVMLIDNAGWHIAKDPSVPPNMSLIHLAALLAGLEHFEVARNRAF